MSFDLASWKEGAADKLQGMGAWLAKRRVQDAPHALYGALCGLSLWPLVEAAQAGQFLPVMVALGSVAGGVGGNLLAEQVQRWKDRAEEAGGLDEEEVAAWAAERAAEDADLRQALDAILEALEAIPQARAAWKNRITIWGGLPSTLLEANEPLEPLRDHLARLYRDVAPGNRFMLAISDQAMPTTGWQHLSLVGQWVRRHGAYPIRPPLLETRSCRS